MTTHRQFIKGQKDNKNNKNNKKDKCVIHLDQSKYQNNPAYNAEVKTKWKKKKKPQTNNTHKK